MRDSIEGFDYLIDRYAVLGISQDADTKAIQRAYHAKISQYHPDKYTTLAPEMQSAAERTSRVITNAYEVLSDPQRRAAFDAQLSTWEGPISQDGIPIIRLRNRLGDVLADPSQLQSDMADFEKALTERAGFDQEMYEYLRDQIQGSDSPPQKLLAAYRRSLTALNTVLTAMESTRREIIDAPDVPAHPPLAYIQHVKQELDACLPVLREQQGQRIAALHSGEMRMLHSGTIEETSLEPQSSAEAMLSVVQRNIDEQAEALEDLAKKRQAIIEERLKYLTILYTPQPERYESKVIIRLQLQGEEAFKIALIITGTEEAGETYYECTHDPELPFETISCLTFDEETTRTYVERGYNIILVNAEEGMPPHETIGRAYEIHSENYFAQEGIE